MYSVFADESHDSKKERIYVVAGLLGTTGQWISLRQTWLERTGGMVFHAAECESGYKGYKDLPREVNEKLYRDLIGMLASSGLIGWGLWN
jgi:hypothetical protein